MISEFQGYVNQAFGFARPTRFQFNIAIDKLINSDFASAYDIYSNGKANNFFKTLGFRNGRYAQRLRFFCHAFQLPAAEFLSTLRTDHGPTWTIPTYQMYTPFGAVFYVGHDMLERAFFDAWIACVQNPQTYDFNYATEFTTDIEIHQMGDISPIPPLPGKAGDIQRIFNDGMDIAGNVAGFIPGGMQIVDKIANFSTNPFSVLGSSKPIFKQLNSVFGSQYVWRVEDAWPLQVTPMDYNAARPDMHTIQVIFEYRRMYNPNLMAVQNVSQANVKTDMSVDPSHVPVPTTDVDLDT